MPIHFVKDKADADGGTPFRPEAGDVQVAVAPAG